MYNSTGVTSFTAWPSKFQGHRKWGQWVETKISLWQMLRDLYNSFLFHRRRKARLYYLSELNKRLQGSNLRLSPFHSLQSIPDVGSKFSLKGAFWLSAAGEKAHLATRPPCRSYSDIHQPLCRSVSQRYLSFLPEKIARYRWAPSPFWYKQNSEKYTGKVMGNNHPIPRGLRRRWNSPFSARPPHRSSFFRHPPATSPEQSSGQIFRFYLHAWIDVIDRSSSFSKQYCLEKCTSKKRGIMI